jgi:type I restriction enzyme S subunit
MTHFDASKSGWKTVKLGQYFQIKHGFAFKGEFFADSGQYILLTPGNFRAEGGIILKGEREKYYAGNFPKEFILKRGDFLIVLTDLTQNAPILGSPAFITEDNKFLHNQRLGKIVNLKKSELDASFLYYLFNSERVRSQIKASATGATVRHTAPDRIYAVEVELPPLPVQRTIAGILSAYDDLIENNTRRIAILEEMARALYHEWFVKFRFPGHENVKMVESELGMIPEGWEIKSVGEAMRILGGGTPSTKENEFWDDGDIVWFSPTDLTSTGTMFISDSAKKITSAGLQHSSARVFPAYSVMMTSRATIGVVAINTKPACTNQGFITCLATERLSAYQIYHWIEQNRQKIISLASGATFKEINKATFRQLPVIVPPVDVSQRFNEAVHPIYKVVENLISRNTSLRRARDLLLPRLISGEIDVSGWAGAEEQEMAESLAGGPGAWRVAEARPDVGAITPIDKDALQWRSLWDEE